MRASRLDGTLLLRRRAFTLVELVIVVVIIGIVSAIAVPRMSTTAGHSSANAMQATLMNVRTAIDCYYAEHDRYPGKNPSGGGESGDSFVKQLTMYSDSKGQTNQTRTASYKFGPYLRTPFPTNLASNLATVHVKKNKNDATPADGTVGWIAVLNTGDFGVSATDSQLDKLGVIEPRDKASVRLRTD